MEPNQAYLRAIQALKARPSRSERFEQLVRHGEGAERGRAFEQALLELLVDAGFRVRRNPNASSPRQVDLYAQRGRQDYLIEAKWRKDKVDISDIDAVRSRLRRTTSDIVGVLFSMSEYSQTALDDVRGDRTREVLLFNPLEVRRLFDGSSDLNKLIENKRRALRRDAMVWFLDPGSDSLPLRGIDLPQADEHVAGQLSSSWRSRNTGHNPIVFTRSIPDVGWNHIGGNGVALHLRLNLEVVRDLHRALEVLHEYGGLSGKGSYSITQTGHMWHGLGVDGFLEDVSRIRQRYADLPSQSKLHHSEELAYFDQYEDGRLIIDARQSAESSRFGELRDGQVEIHLSGVPIDMEPFERLCVESGNLRASFIPRPERLTWRAKVSVPLEACARINMLSRNGDDVEDSATTALIVKNPFFGKAGPLFDGDSGNEGQALSYSEHLICDLRDWHGPEDVVDGYHLVGIETLQCGAYCIARPVCTWGGMLVRKE